MTDHTLNLDGVNLDDVVLSEFQPGLPLTAAALEAGVSVEMIQQWFGLWAIEETFGKRLSEQLSGFNLPQHLQSQTTILNVNGDLMPSAAAPSALMDSRPREPQTFGGVQVIDMRGTIQKRASSFGGASTIAARKHIRAADRDPDVKHIILRVDSPGGTVSGMMELAADVAATQTPLTGFVEDLAASAGFWAIANADRIVANTPIANVGSIGVFMLVQDSSKMAEDVGIKVHILKTGEFKGAGAPGIEITEAQLEYIQQRVDRTFEEFLSVVQNGRGIERSALMEIADGRVFPADEAVRLGLIDEVKSLDELVEELVAAPAASVTRTHGRGKAMSNTNAAKPATISQLRAACPGAPDTFILEQVEAESTVESAASAFETFQLRQQIKDAEAATAKAEAEAAAAKEETEKAKAKAAKAKADTPSVPAVGGSADSDDTEMDADDPLLAWPAACEAEIKSGRHDSRAAAVAAADRKHPGLRESFTEASNERRQVRPRTKPNAKL